VLAALGVAGILTCSFAVVSASRPALLAELEGVRVRHDVYPLPSPEQTLVMSLGSRAALAGFLYGNVLVSYGLHFQERRLFEFVGQYLDTINALDPKFRAPYRFADTLLTLQPEQPPVSHYRKAREILERDMRELPHDGELWSSAGQFIAYLGPPRLPTQKEKREWERAGALVLARACELLGATALQAHCDTTAGLLTRSGEREAVVRFLERVVAVSDDPEVREQALALLGAHLDDERRQRTLKRRQAFVEAYRHDLGFLTEGTALALGPRFEPAACAGAGRFDQAECAASWRAWAEQLDAD
jgi:hypothetical protein